MIGAIRQIDRQQLAALLARPPARRIANVHAIDAKLDVLTRKIDSL